MENRYTLVKITLHPPFVEPGVDVIKPTFLPAIGGEDGAFASSV
jgi:hypothetical protein